MIFAFGLPSSFSQKRNNKSIKEVSINKAVEYNLNVPDSVINKDTSVNDSIQNRLKVNAKLKEFYEETYILFTYGFCIIFVLLLFTVLTIAMFKDSDNKLLILGKFIILVFSLGLAYLSLRMINLENFLFFKPKSNLIWPIIIMVFLLAFLSSYLINKLLALDKVFYIFTLIIVTTIALFYFLFFLSEINLFLVRNEFYSLCVVSLTLGGLLDTGTRMIRKGLTNKIIKED